MIWRNTKIKVKLVFSLLLLVGFFVSVFYIINLDYQKGNVEQLILSKIYTSRLNLENKQKNDVRMFSSLLTVLTQDISIKQLYLSNDREELNKHIEPLFETFKNQAYITHWNFISPEGEVFLRMSDNTIFGDQIKRITFTNARDTKKISSGLELGKTGYALRTVIPYYNNNELIGYIELGEEINHFLNNLDSETKDKFSIFVDKSKLDRADWKLTRESAGLSDNWDEYDNLIPVSFTSNSEMAKECLVDQKIVDKVLNIANESYKCNGFELNTIGDQSDGIVVSLVNITEYAQLISDSNNKILVWVFVLIFFAIFIGLLLSRSLIRPIESISQTAKEILLGNLDSRIKVSSEDEIGQLANSFNDMLNKLQNSQTILENQIRDRTRELEESKMDLLRVNKQLEGNVSERTKELEKLKQDLEIIVEQRTNQLNSKVFELEKINKIMIDREIKMIEMKDELERLRSSTSSQN